MSQIPTTLTDDVARGASNSAEVPLLHIKGLEVSFSTSTGLVPAVRGVDLTVYAGQTVAIVGESGSGKSTTAHAIIDLLPGTGKVTAGSIMFDGDDITRIGDRFKNDPNAYLESRARAGVTLERAYETVDDYIEETLDLSGMLREALQSLTDAEREAALEKIRSLAARFTAEDGSLRLTGSSLVASAAA